MTDGRRVRGSIKDGLRDGVASWKGTPLAAPPVGQLRWRAPQPAAAATGVCDATAYAHDCVQVPFPSDAAPLGTTPAEDCLYANVWKPASAGATATLPAVVWIVGGGFVNGGASPRPTRALTWPNRVYGPDSGAQVGAAQRRRVRRSFEQRHDHRRERGRESVHMLNTSPLARGLFRKAVVMSGGNGQSDRKTLADAEQVGAAFARSKNIDPAAFDALARLRALSPDEVTAGLNMAQIFRPAAGRATSTGPLIEKVVGAARQRAWRQAPSHPAAW